MSDLSWRSGLNAHESALQEDQRCRDGIIDCRRLSFVATYSRTSSRRMSVVIALLTCFLRVPLSCMRRKGHHIFPTSFFGTHGDPGNSSRRTIRPPYLLDMPGTPGSTGSSRTRVVPCSVVGICHDASVAWPELIRLPLPSPMYEGRGHIS